MPNLITPTQSKLLAALPGVQHGFTSRDMPKADADALDTVVATAKQVHKADLIWVGGYEKKARDADAVATFTPGLPVGVYSADCTPVLVAAQDQQTKKIYAAMAVHGGWRGTAALIAEKSLRAFIHETRVRHPGPTRYVAAIGPCISYESFEVHDDVFRAFPGAETRGLARYLKDEDGRPKYLVNLPGENERQLRFAANELQVPLAVEQLGLCTVKLPERFPSYRRDHAGAGRILSFLAFSA